jgi:DNA polymerase III epsilon subunit-like protein
MSKQERRWNTLWEVKQVADAANWVTFDSETTSLEGEVIQWAICAPNGSVVGEGLVKPTEPITEGARAIHGITDEMLADAPTFDLVAPRIWSLLEGKTVVIYNASFDTSRLYTSLYAHTDYRDEEAHKRAHWLLHELETHCAMEWFATIYGEWHSYFRSYTWQKLTTACSYFDIPHSEAHNATCDAQATAALVHKLAELARAELPIGYHPPRNEPCAGGCGKTLGPFAFDEDHAWYCLTCGLAAGINRLCPCCLEQGKSTIVSPIQAHHDPVPEGALCLLCLFETNMASGAWHKCPICTRTIEANIEQQSTCTTCQRSEERRKAKQRNRQRQYRARKKGRGSALIAAREAAQREHSDAQILSAWIEREGQNDSEIFYTIGVHLSSHELAYVYEVLLKGEETSITLLGMGRQMTQETPFSSKEEHQATRID